MNLHSIRVKSSIPMLLLGCTLLIVIAMFSYLSSLQKAALDAQANHFLKAISVVLNADRDLYQARLASTYLQHGVGDAEAQRQEVQDNAAQVAERFGQYLQHLQSYPEIGRQFSQFNQQFSQWQQSNQQLLQTADTSPEFAALYQIEDQHFAALRKLLDQAGEAALETSIAQQQQLSTDIATFQSMAYGISLLILLLAGWYSYKIPRQLTGQITTLTERIQEIASGEGDLTARLKVLTKDEFADLAQAFNGFVGNLNHLIASVLQQARQLQQLTEQLSSAANESKQVNQSLNLASDSIVSAVHQMAVANREMATVATGSAQEAELASQNASQGISVVNQVNQSMAQLSSDVDSALQYSTELEQSSGNIASVLDVIRAIAEQTNLLALNAAIEAARAGEQGRGFAVVADEVRTLASRTQRSTEDIQQMIQNLQSRVKQAAMAIHSGKSNADRTVGFFTAAEQVFQQLQLSSQRVNDMATQTATATEEQSLVSEEITRNLSALHDQAAAAGHIADSNNSLSLQIRQLSETLFGLVGRFRIQ
jgi:methyl-accepting chemotaxis protein